MGNHTSSTATAKLLDSQGNLTKVTLPIQAAELMLEHPGNTVSSAAHLRSTRRVVPLRADDELIPGKLYLLIPLNRINSKVSDSEIAAISKYSRTNKVITGHKHKNICKVSPAAKKDLAFLTTQEENRSQIHTRNRRQWNPVLEPITEY